MPSASTIYVPQPVTIVNPNFTESSTLPPVGWQAGGAGLDSTATLSYDTVNPYGDNTQSLVIDSTASGSGISSIIAFPVQFGQVYQIEAALLSISGDPAAAQLLFLDVNGNPITGYLAGNGVNYQPFVYTLSQSWVVLTAQGTVPHGAVSCQVECFVDSLTGGVGEFGYVAATLLSTAIPYYLAKVPSQFQGAPKFMQFLAALLQPLVDMGICAASMNIAFSLASAVGPQLDTLGIILGQPRTVPLPFVGTIVSAVATRNHSGSGYLIGDVVSVVQAGASGGQLKIVGFGFNNLPRLAVLAGGTGYATANNLSTTGGSGSGLEVNIVAQLGVSITLDDPHYRTLLQAKVLRNQWDGQADSLFLPWQQMFPGGSIYITDNQNMTATVFLVGTFDSIYETLILNGYIVPRPEGVLYNYEFASLPIFGFGNLNPVLIEGFGTGSGVYPGGNWA